jgi:hypothetical protein
VGMRRFSHPDDVLSFLRTVGDVLQEEGEWVAILLKLDVLKVLV